MNDGDDIHALLSMDDPDDQFIFGLALNELIPGIKLSIFQQGSELSDYLLKAVRGAKDQPANLFIFADLRPPFFSSSHLRFIRSLTNFDRTPLYVVAESYVQTDTADLQSKGATGFFYKPASLCALKNKLDEIFFAHGVSTGKRGIVRDENQSR